MAIKTTRPPRTLSDIKTVAGRSSNKNQRRYASYFQLGALELERYRRGLERDAAQGRIDGINERLGEIETEMQGLLVEAGVEGVQRSTKQDARAPAGRRSETCSRSTSGEPTGQSRGLRIRY
ncbi:hypothetical protein [Halochromatium roseum]|uniref:hypothetical protein n=1 Tax=Halochromatium roseum TaxID=391920 RepID=UPI0019141FF3|nr:hypothetical protein [Halochromatium roseum]MBK5939884.1 hypothetical protein [Halochromatium roseum]